MTLVNFNRPGGVPMHNLVSGMLNDLPAVFSQSKMVARYPLTNITETADSYLLDLIVPGYTKEQISIRVEDKLLTISGEVNSEENSAGNKVIRKEFTLQPFTRAFTVDESIDSDNVSAKYENGLLSLALPKKVVAKNEVKKIDIQ